MSHRGLQIAVVGAGVCDRDLESLAYEVGGAIARAGALLVCGGREGVMAAACAGAREAGGLTLGILPGADGDDSAPNPDVAIAVFTGFGQGRNLPVVLSGDAVIAVGGGWGTLSEIALALKHGRPVVLLRSWALRRPDGAAEPLLRVASSAAEAVALARELAGGAPAGPESA
jgi:uncharacterized protein (TIGR00725 family)